MCSNRCTAKCPRLKVRWTKEPILESIIVPTIRSCLLQVLNCFDFLEPLAFLSTTMAGGAATTTTTTTTTMPMAMSSTMTSCWVPRCGACNSLYRICSHCQSVNYCNCFCFTKHQSSRQASCRQQQQQQQQRPIQQQRVHCCEFKCQVLSRCEVDGLACIVCQSYGQCMCKCRQYFHRRVENLLSSKREVLSRIDWFCCEQDRLKLLTCPICFRPNLCRCCCTSGTSQPKTVYDKCVATKNFTRRYLIENK